VLGHVRSVELGEVVRELKHFVMSGVVVEASSWPERSFARSWRLW
jgi:hypothetical protein